MEAKKDGRRRSSTTKIVEVPQVDQYGHKQPQSLDMEVAVLGALMVEQDSYGLVAELLKPESFYDHRHQLIYQAIQTLNAEQKPVDIMTVIEQLERTDNLEASGGEVYLMQINAQVASSAHIEYHAKVIAQKSLQRQLITFASLVQTKAFDALTMNWQRLDFPKYEGCALCGKHPTITSLKEYAFQPCVKGKKKKT